MSPGEIVLPVQTPIVKPSRGLTTQLFTTERAFAYLFRSRCYCSVYGSRTAYYLVQDAAFFHMRKKADAGHDVQVEVYSSWLIDGVLTEKLMREFQLHENAMPRDVVWNAVKFLHRSGPFGKRTPPNFRDEDRNWKLYTDENGVKRLRLSLEYQRIPGK